jgi:hypothetical protein
MENGRKQYGTYPAGGFIQTTTTYSIRTNYTVGSPILSTTPYRTVPYRFPLQFLSRSRSLSARRTVFFA